MFSSSRPSHPPPAPSVIRQSTHLARRTLRAAIVGACAIVLGLIAERALFHATSTDAAARLRQAAELSTRVLLLDERLTMSAEMAVATGEESWIQRYEAALPLMGQAIAQANALAPPPVAARFDAEARAANDALVALDRAAFDLVRSGQRAKARAILQGPGYAGHKWVLAQGSERLMAALVAEAEAQTKFLLWRAAGIASGLVLLGLGGLWWILGRGLAKAEQGFVQAEYALAQSLSDLNEANRHLAQQNIRFDTALDNIGQGLCFFDGEGRLIVANRLYAEMYGLTLEDVRPGTKLEAIVARRERIGTGPAGMAARDYVAWRAEATRAELDRPFAVELPLADGRIVSINHRPLPGGGWVATHEDITAQRLAEEARRRTEAALREQHDRFDAALTNMSQGLCMFDAGERLVVHNANYLDLLRWPADAVRPGMTHHELYGGLIERGVYPPNPTAAEASEMVRAKLAAEDTTPIYREMTDGRIVAVRHRAMTGGGWVATFEDVTEQRRTEAAVAYMARHDALTNLPNRVLLHEHLAEALGWMGDGDAPEAGLAVLCLDLDHFKPVNDTLGHPVGDALLCAVARRIEAVTAATDGFSAIVARLGGDEFALVLSQSPGEGGPAAPLQRGVAAFCERLVAEVSRPYDLEGHEVIVGASVGFALAPRDGRDTFELLKMADLALYQAKAGGRGTYRQFEPEMDASVQARRALEVDLRAALSRGEFELHYQPLFDLRAEAVSGFEALLRWRHPERGWVSPAEFIPLAEEIGLISTIGDWVLRTACAQAATWPRHLKIAVNLSPVQFRSRSLVAAVVQAIAATGLLPRQLELEVTESVLLECSQANLEQLHQLRALGVRIAMDDFGTGYSSLSYLRTFPFDKIKIDRSFVRNASAGAEGGDSQGRAIVRAVAGLGASLGICTTAEGVETQEELDLARSEGCTEVQGYLISRPRPAAEIAPFITGAAPGRSFAA